MFVKKFVRACSSVARPARSNIAATLQQNVSFNDFCLSTATARGVADVLKLTTPTQAQVAFIPAAISKSIDIQISNESDGKIDSETASGSNQKRFVTQQRHFFLQAPNGTGKTVACLIPLLEKVLQRTNTNSTCDVSNVNVNNVKSMTSSAKAKPKSIVPKALVICPSWELVWQMGRCRQTGLRPV